MHLRRMASLQNPPMGWTGVPPIPVTPIVKRVVRLDVPIDKYPNVSYDVYIDIKCFLIFVLFPFKS